MTQQLPSGFFVDTEGLPEGFTIDEAEEPSMIDKAGDFFTGSLRTTPDMERTPSIMESRGFFSDATFSQAAKVAGLMALTNDPDEIAEIILATIPNTRIQHNKDAQGNVYPLIVNSRGEVATVDKAGIDLMNMGQFLSQAAAFTPAGRASTVGGAIVKEAATQTAIEGAQELSGGSFDTKDVMLAGVLGGTGKAVEKGLGSVYRGLKGTQTDEVENVLELGLEHNVPVMTTDVVPPKTPLGRAGQIMTETIPIIGTGEKRAAQQEARVKATNKFIERYQGGTYTQIIQGLKDKKDKVKKAAAKVYQSINPKLAALGDIEFSNTAKALDDASELFSREGRVSSPKAMELLEEISGITRGGGQDFQTVKDNIGAWFEKVDSIDPAIKSQMSTKDAGELKKVLTALRKDRDSFAKNNLTDQEYRRLKSADAHHGEMAKELKRTKTKALLDKGDVTPEIARQALFSTNKSDVERLFKGLTTEGRVNARAIIIQEIAETLSKRAGGITPDTLATELKKRSQSIDVFFRGQDRTQLKGFLRLMDHTRRAQQSKAEMAAPTGQRVIPHLALMGVLGWGADPSLAVGYLTIGALGRAYENPKVRSIMARMSSIEAGSTEFERMADILQQTLQASAQAGKGDQ